MHKSRRTRVIIYCGEEVLLIKSNFGGQKWGLPGGGIKRRELPEQSAVREVFEELGVQLSPKKLSFLVAQRSGFGQRSWPYVDLVFYEYRLSKKPLRLKLQRFEVSEARWVASKDFEHLEIGEDIMTLLGATGE
jgi:8-oxo-dGTP pyrophosphatase MutT (NUDIX family)